MKISLDTNKFAACLHVAPKQEVRYCLVGVLIDASKARMVATDGHCMLVASGAITAEADSELPAPFIFPREPGLAMVKAARKAKLYTIDMDVTDTDISYTIAGSTVTLKAVDGKFPDYERLIPREVSAESGQYNPEILATMQDAMSIAMDKKNSFVTLHGNGNNSAAMMTCSDDSLLGIVMPWRASAPAKVPAALALYHGIPVTEAQAA